jgi:hypothetical protein
MTDYRDNEVPVITVFATSLLFGHVLEIWPLHMLCKCIVLMYNMDGGAV